MTKLPQVVVMVEGVTIMELPGVPVAPAVAEVMMEADPMLEVEQQGKDTTAVR
jgi:hypothetical protein